MKIYYNPKDDLLHITLKESKEVRNERYSDDIVFDLDKENKVVGIEILNTSKYLELNDLLSVTLVQERVAS
ncbi:MAG: DUF2283 domain-containing protein [Bacteroidota bacterium]|nr:DUF2283 domain-containing protein [Bacteroidota bacterium]